MIHSQDEPQSWFALARTRIRAWISKATRYLFTGRRGKIASFIFLLISLIVIGSIIVGNREMLRNYQWQLDPIWLVYIALFFTIDLMLAGWAWHLLTARLANFRNFRRSLKITWYANLARRMPGPVWYIANRAVLYEKEGVSKMTASLLSALELAFFLVSGVVTTLLTLPFWLLPPALTDQLSQSWVLLLLLPLSALLVHPRVLEKVWRRFSDQVPEQELRWRDTVAWLALYVVIWAVGGLVLYSVINLFQPVALDQVIPLIGMWSLSGSISLAGAITITSIGLREVSLALLLTQLVPAPVSIIIVVAIRLVWLIGELSSALISLKL